MSLTPTEHRGRIMIHSRVRAADGSGHCDVPLAVLGQWLAEPGALAWLDLEQPTADEVALVGGLLGWDSLTVEDLTKQGQRAKQENFDTYAYLVMHALTYEGAAPRLAVHEVDFIIGAGYVVTAHSLPLPHITESRQPARNTEAMLRNGTDYLLYVLADRLVDSYFPVLDAIDDAIDALQDEIVTDPAPALMARIFDMKRDVVLLRKVINPQVEIFSRLAGPEYGIVSDRHTLYFRDVHDHIIRLHEMVDGYRDLMSNALDAYLSTVSNHVNEVVKRLTLLATLFLPVTFITGLLGMNLAHDPPWRDNWFWVFLAGMAAISLSQWLYFRYRRWV
jgi:magnesium transporter